MTHLMRDIQIEEQDLRDLKITQEQYSNFIGSFKEIVNGPTKETGKETEVQSAKPRMHI
jgi:hypothetical protein